MNPAPLIKTELRQRTTLRLTWRRVTGGAEAGRSGPARRSEPQRNTASDGADLLEPATGRVAAHEQRRRADIGDDADRARDVIPWSHAPQRKAVGRVAEKGDPAIGAGITLEHPGAFDESWVVDATAPPPAAGAVVVDERSLLVDSERVPNEFSGMLLAMVPALSTVAPQAPLIRTSAPVEPVAALVTVARPPSNSLVLLDLP